MKWTYKKLLRKIRRNHLHLDNLNIVTNKKIENIKKMKNQIHKPPKEHKVYLIGFSRDQLFQKSQNLKDKLK